MIYNLNDEFLKCIGLKDYTEIYHKFKKSVYPAIESIKGQELWQISECEAFSLFATVFIIKPRIIIETGVGAGLSSLSILSALENGRLISIDPLISYGNPPRKDFGFLVPDYLRKNWNIRKGLSRDIMPKLLDEIGFIDIFLHDSEHSYDNMYFEVNYPALTDGASPPRDEDFLLLPGNLLYTPSEKGMYSRGFLSTGSKGSPDPARRIFREAL